MPIISKVSDSSIRLPWENRRASLEPLFDFERQRLDRLREYFEAHRTSEPLIGFNRNNTLATLLNGLDAFAEEQFDFFFRGFFDTNAHKFVTGEKIKNPFYRKFEKLQVEDARDAVLSTVLSKVSYDLDILARIMDQRFAKGDIARRLLEADKLTASALIAMGDTFGLFAKEPNTTLITYFSSRMNIRVIPYASVALVGLPMTALKEDRDLLAIPHEVGHLLYWKSAIRREKDGERVQRSISNIFKFVANDTWIYEWEEEIFSDVVSCLIGGPAIVPGLQDLMKTQVGDEFTHNDGVHPIPAIRPFILYYVLENFLGEKEYAEKQKKQWNDILLRREVDLATANVRVNGQSKSLADWSEVVHGMIDLILQSEIFDGTQESFELSSCKQMGRWSVGDDNFDRKAIIDDITNKSQTAHWDLQGTLPFAAPESERKKFWGERLSQFVLRRMSATPDWWDAENLSIRHDAELQADDWLAILEFGGWTTEGPGPGQVIPPK